MHGVDLSKHKSISDLCEWLEGEGLVPDLLINNAGSGDRGAFVTSDFGRVNDMMQVNVVSLTLLTRKLLPAMIAAKRGAILNVSSSASFLPMPGLGGLRGDARLTSPVSPKRCGAKCAATASP